MHSHSVHPISPAVDKKRMGNPLLYVLHEGLIQWTVLLVYPIEAPLSSV